MDMIAGTRPISIGTRAHLAALDGVRFLAAFCVLAGHGYWYVVSQQQASTTGGPAQITEKVMLAVPALGMTLFFVLSGFVIHLNYHGTAGIRRGGTLAFFIARFSRLYPLFLAVFAFAVVPIVLQPPGGFDAIRPLAFFLTFSQSWLFVPIDGHALYDHFGYGGHPSGGATGAMWSLSTEWAFYLAYPLLSGWLTRLKGRRLAGAAGLVALAGLGYYGWCAYYDATIQSVGLALFGSQPLADAFVGWVAFYAPWGRVAEFLLGGFAAQHYLSSLSGRTSAWQAGAAAIALALRLAAVNGSCAGAPIALCILLIARHRTAFGLLLSGRLVVKCGQASYSLYLLHYFTLHEWAAPLAAPFSAGGRTAVYLLGLLVSLGVAQIAYEGFERPMLRWLRGRLLSGRRARLYTNG
jgi:peptidoglycan/LPS O-acetylase OafA/YrhL